MAYCQNCGANIDANVNFCSNGGTEINGTNTTNSNTQNINQQWSNTAKTVGTVAGAVVGASLLSHLFHRRRRPPMMHHHGPMGGPGGHGHGPMGGPGGRR